MVRATRAGACKKESFADEETCGDRYHMEHAGRWIDQRVAILADQPLCSDELDEQSSSSPVLHGSSFSRGFHQRWPLRSGPARCARDVTTLSVPGPVLRVLKLKSSKCACVKISASVWGILGDEQPLLHLSQEKVHSVIK